MDLLKQRVGWACAGAAAMALLAALVNWCSP